MAKKVANSNAETVQGYKAFDKNMQCRCFQYEVGKTYTHDGPVRLCDTGFHFCQNPLDVLTYYPPTSNFAKVEGTGVTKEQGGCSKRAAKSIYIAEAISITALIKEGVAYLRGLTTATTGYYAHSATTGDSAHSATTGNSAHSATTGNSAHSATTGNSAHSATTGNYAYSATTGDSAHSATTGNYAYSATTGDSAHSATTGNSAHSATTGYSAISAALGCQGRAKAAKGSWLVLAEYDDKYRVNDVQAVKVDGETIKAHTWYSLRDGKFVEV